MSQNMREWVEKIIAEQVKKPLPVLSFPCVQLQNVSVRDLVRSSELQAAGMKAVVM